MDLVVAALGGLGALLTVAGAYFAERRLALGRALAAARIQLAEFEEARIRVKQAIMHKRLVPLESLDLSSWATYREALALELPRCGVAFEDVQDAAAAILDLTTMLKRSAERVATHEAAVAAAPRPDSPLARPTGTSPRRETAAQARLSDVQLGQVETLNSQLEKACKQLESFITHVEKRRTVRKVSSVVAGLAALTAIALAIVVGAGAFSSPAQRATATAVAKAIAQRVVPGARFSACDLLSGSRLRFVCTTISNSSVGCRPASFTHTDTTRPILIAMAQGLPASCGVREWLAEADEEDRMLALERLDLREAEHPGRVQLDPKRTLLVRLFSRGR